MFSKLASPRLGVARGGYLSYDVPAELTYNHVLKHTFSASLFDPGRQILGMHRGSFDFSSMDATFMLKGKLSHTSVKLFEIFGRFCGPSFAALGEDVQPS